MRSDKGGLGERLMQAPAGRTLSALGCGQTADIPRRSCCRRGGGVSGMRRGLCETRRACPIRAERASGGAGLAPAAGSEPRRRGKNGGLTFGASSPPSDPELKWGGLAVGPFGGREGEVTPA